VDFQRCFTDAANHSLQERQLKVATETSVVEVVGSLQHAAGRIPSRCEGLKTSVDVVEWRKLVGCAWSVLNQGVGYFLPNKNAAFQRIRPKWPRSVNFILPTRLKS
jgi:hypothetical protein